MIFHNVKIYMAENSVMYNFFHSSGIPIQSYQLLNQQDFAGFTSPVKIENEEKFEEFIKKISGIEGVVSLWRNIYDTLRSDLK